MNAAPGTNDEPRKPGTQEGGGSTLRIIAGFKLAEALLLIVAGLGALGLLDQVVQHELVEWLDDLSLREGRRLTSELAGQAAHLLGTMPGHRLLWIAVGCFGYGCVFIVEAVGLWLRKRWAEYLTIVVTASLLPLELIELTHRVSIGKVLTLLVNLLVLGYLVWNVAKKREQD